MKHKQKLAIDQYMKDFDAGFPDRSFIEGYIMGFDKARDMAIDSISKHPDQACLHEFDIIGNIGEEEV